MTHIKAPVPPVYLTAAEARSISVNEGYLVVLEHIHNEIDNASNLGLQSILLKNAVFANVLMERNDADPYKPQKFHPRYTEQQQKVVDHLVDLGYSVECIGGNYNGKNIIVSWDVV